MSDIPLSDRPPVIATNDRPPGAEATQMQPQPHPPSQSHQQRHQQDPTSRLPLPSYSPPPAPSTPPSPPPPPLPPSPVFIYNRRTNSLQLRSPLALPPPALSPHVQSPEPPQPQNGGGTQLHHLIFGDDDNTPRTDEPLPAYSRYPKKGVDTSLYSTPLHGGLGDEEDGRMRGGLSGPAGVWGTRKRGRMVCGVHLRTLVLGIGILVFVGVIVGVVMGWKLKTRPNHWDTTSDMQNLQNWQNYPTPGPENPRMTRPEHTRPDGAGEDDDGDRFAWQENHELAEAVPILPGKPGV